MTKTKMTMRDFKNWRRAYACGYCDLSNIMRGYDPQYYNSGVYGWNCDIYADYTRDIIISTGYRNMRGEWIPREFLDKFDKKARSIMNSKKYTSYEARQKALDKNREAFFAALEKAEF